MENLIISMEATCDLPQEIIEKYDFKIVPMEYMVGDKVFNTATSTLQDSGLYESMQKGAKVSTTQVNSTLYLDFFNNLLKEEKPILHLGLSSGLSGTINSCRTAIEELNSKNAGKIHLIDTLAGCNAQGMLGILASEYAKSAENIEDVIKYIEEIKWKLNMCYSLDVLKYQVSGGRIKASTALIGTFLNIKPVMKVDNEGHLVMDKKVISRQKALLTLANDFIKRHDTKNDMCFISHALCEHDAEFIKNVIISKTNAKPIITNLGPIIGLHSGPGTIAIFYFSNKRH